MISRLKTARSVLSLAPVPTDVSNLGLLLVFETEICLLTAGSGLSAVVFVESSDAGELEEQRMATGGPIEHHGDTSPRCVFPCRTGWQRMMEPFSVSGTIPEESPSSAWDGVESGAGMKRDR